MRTVGRANAPTPVAFKWRDITVRMPDGARWETKGVRMKECWMVMIPTNYVPENPKWGRGLHTGEVALYIRPRAFFPFRISWKWERSSLCARHLLENFFMRDKGRFQHIMEELHECKDRKECRKCLAAHLHDDAFWTLGGTAATKTRGLGALLRRIDEFTGLYTMDKRLVTDCNPELFWTETE